MFRKCTVGLKVLLWIVWIVACVLTVACMVNGLRSGSLTTSYSEYDDKTMTEFVMKEFGHCNTMEEMLYEADLYVCKNFEYDYDLADKKFFLQYSRVQETIDTKKGICFDFAMFVKVCGTVFAREKGIDAKVYIASCDSLTGDVGHSYNYIVTNGHTYHLDTTFDNTDYDNGRIPFGLLELDGISIKEHSRSIGYRVKELR